MASSSSYQNGERSYFDNNDENHDFNAGTTSSDALSGSTLYTPPSLYAQSSGGSSLNPRRRQMGHRRNRHVLSVNTNFGHRPFVPSNHFETSRNNTSRDVTSRNDISHNNTSHNNTSHQNASHNNSSRNDTSRSDTSREGFDGGDTIRARRIHNNTSHASSIAGNTIRASSGFSNTSNGFILYHNTLSGDTLNNNISGNPLHGNTTQGRISIGTFGQDDSGSTRRDHDRLRHSTSYNGYDYAHSYFAGTDDDLNELSDSSDDTVTIPGTHGPLATAHTAAYATAHTDATVDTDTDADHNADYETEPIEDRDLGDPADIDDWWRRAEPVLGHERWVANACELLHFDTRTWRFGGPVNRRQMEGTRPSPTARWEQTPFDAEFGGVGAEEEGGEGDHDLPEMEGLDGESEADHNAELEAYSRLFDHPGRCPSQHVARETGFVSTSPLRSQNIPSTLSPDHTQPPQDHPASAPARLSSEQTFSDIAKDDGNDSSSEDWDYPQVESPDWEETEPQISFFLDTLYLDEHHGDA